MKYLKQKLFAVLLVCVVTVINCVHCAEAKTVEFKFVNLTGRSVYIAFAREGHSNDVSTKGWWKLDYLETKVIKPFEFDPDDYYFYYAVSGNTVWKGDAFTGWIHPKEPFKSEWGRRIPGGKQVGFRVLKVSKSGKASLNLSIKRN